MKLNVYFFLTLITLGCQKDNPVTTEQPQLPELPLVKVTQSNYTEPDIQSRVPDTTYKNKCCSMYNNHLTDSSKKYVVTVLLQKALYLNQDTSIVSECLKATGQLRDGILSVPYFAERAKYQSKECWIFEFTWGLSSNDLGHYRCFVIDVAAKDTLLFITCK
ncbi:MAG: hypothetical protein V1799_17480 [bacterium]